MSITGSLVGYENNNDMANCSLGGGSSISRKNRSLLNMSSASTKQCVSLNSSISNSVITTASSSVSNSNSKHQNHTNRSKQHQRNHKRKRRLHLNSLWSIWYGVLVSLVLVYLILDGVYRYIGCSLLTWKHGEPFTELTIQFVMCVFSVALLLMFLYAALFKVGNLANDGIKLGTGSGSCSSEPENGLEVEAPGGTIRALWTHGGPTSAFVHILVALCLLLPRLLLEARLIENGNLPRENIWRTELDFMVTHRDRLVVLSFMTTSPYQNGSHGLLNGHDGHQHPTNHLDNHRSGNGKGNTDDLNVDDGEDDDYSIDEMIYEKTHLIEKFREEENGMDMFGKLEDGELPPTKMASATTSTTMSIPTTAMVSTFATRQTTAHYVRTTAAEANRKTGKTRSNGNGKRKQNKNRPDTENADSFEATQSAFPTKVTKRERNNRRGGSEDIDEKLELQSNSRVDFGRMKDYELTTVFEEAATKSSHVTQRKMQIKTKDTDILLVNPDKTNEGIVGSSSVTPFSTDSKIIAIRPSKSGRKVREFSEDMNEDEDKSLEEIESMFQIEAAALLGAVPMNNSAVPVQLKGFRKRLQDILGIYEPIHASAWSSHPSLEFWNLAVALAVWSARYPSVFWGTSKAFALVFSLQMISNGFDILLGFAGISVLYKLQIVGQSLPLHAPPLLLNAVVTISLFLLSTILIISSSLILYLYGHGRLSARIRDRRIISSKTNDTWAYFSHCASLCFVLALAVVKASLMHDLSAAYRGSLDGAVLIAALASVMHILFWIVMWLVLTAKRRWDFKLPPLPLQNPSNLHQPLLISPRSGRLSSLSGQHQNQHHQQHQQLLGPNGGVGAVEDIYWPKQPSSPKLKVTFNEIPSTSSDHDLMGEHDGNQRHSGRRASLCLSSPPGEADDGDYATLRGPTGDYLHLSDLAHDMMADDTSEEGKLLACVRDDSVTYASTRDLEPPTTTTTITSSNNSSATSPPLPGMSSDDDQDLPPPPDNFLLDSLDGMISPLAPVTVTVHTNEAHITSSLTPRCLRRADSGVPTDVLLTPRSETTSTESSTSPPERAPSETSSGVHSGEEREEIYIRSRQPKAVPKPPPPAIQEEPFGRSTNMRMSSFNKEGKSSSTLPLNRGANEPRHEYLSNHCNTMPLPIGCHQQQYRSQVFQPNSANASPFPSHRNSMGSHHPQPHSTLPSAIRFATATPLIGHSFTAANFLRRVPHVKNAESPYGILGLGAGHHTFSKLLHDPLCHSIPEDRDSANYSMISDQDREMFAAGH